MAVSLIRMSVMWLRKPRIFPDEEYINTKQKELIEFRQTYAEVAAGQKRMQKQLQQAEGLMEVGFYRP
jgi:hypothetical protein